MFGFKKTINLAYSTKHKSSYSHGYRNLGVKNSINNKEVHKKIRKKSKGTFKELDKLKRI